jgi:hypothetical protein
VSLWRQRWNIGVVANGPRDLDLPPAGPGPPKQIRQRDRFFTVLSYLPARRLIR